MERGRPVSVVGLQGRFVLGGTVRVEGQGVSANVDRKSTIGARILVMDFAQRGTLSHRRYCKADFFFF